MVLVVFAVVAALGMASIAYYTPTAATRELDEKVTDLRGDPATEDLKKEEPYGPLCFRLGEFLVT